MRLNLTFLALTLASTAVLPTEVAAQSQNEEHIASLLEIAKDLRAAGKDDVADTLEAQARKLLSPRTKRDPMRARRTATRLPGVSFVAPHSRAVAPKTPPHSSVDPVVAPVPRSRVRPPEVPPAPSTPAPAPRGRALFSYSKSGSDRELNISRRLLPGESSARVDTGRGQIRYVPITTSRDEQGRVVWRGLPLRGEAARVRDEMNYPTRAPALDAGRDSAAEKAALEARVESLSDEVRAMRKVLDRLSEQLRSESRKRPSRSSR